MNPQIGVLLVNLGTPASSSPKDVYRYLVQFLTDPRVIDLSWLRRQLLVRGFIVPSRYRQSAAAYQQIWTPDGSPLLVYGYRVKKLLQEALGIKYHVEIAMRYQQPSIRDGLASLMKRPLQKLIVLPLFPHYASATTGSVHQKVMEELCQYDTIPEVTLVRDYGDHPALISAFCAMAPKEQIHSADHILFSFHGLPEAQIRKTDHSYPAQCHATADAIANKLGLSSDRFSVCFQSRLGKDPWLQPYASDVIERLAREGKQKIAVYCPSFVCDCLETSYEIAVEYAKEFNHAGGKELKLIPGLNEHPAWIETLRCLVHEKGSTPVIYSTF